MTAEREEEKIRHRQMKDEELIAGLMGEELSPAKREAHILGKIAFIKERLARFDEVVKQSSAWGYSDQTKLYTIGQDLEDSLTVQRVRLAELRGE